MLSKKDSYYMALQELAAVLMGLTIGTIGAYYCPHIIPAFVRYPLGLVIGWIWLASVPMAFIYRKNK